MAEIVSAAFPVFVTMMVWAALVPPTSCVNVSVPGLSETTGMTAEAVPESAMVCGELAALSRTDNVAAALPATVGVKVTEKVQLADAATVLPQALAIANELPPLPLIEMPLTVSAALPVLVRGDALRRAGRTRHGAEGERRGAERDARSRVRRGRRDGRRALSEVAGAAADKRAEDKSREGGDAAGPERRHHSFLIE